MNASPLHGPDVAALNPSELRDDRGHLSGSYYDLGGQQLLDRSPSKTQTSHSQSVKDVSQVLHAWPQRAEQLMATKDQPARVLKLVETH